MPSNVHRGEREVPGVGVLVYDWNAIARLVDEFGPEFDKVISEACVKLDLDVLAKAVAIGTGAPVDEIKSIAPPIMPTQTAIISALNLAFHGQKGAPPASGESNPPVPDR